MHLQPSVSSSHIWGTSVLKKPIGVSASDSQTVGMANPNTTWKSWLKKTEKMLVSSPHLPPVRYRRSNTPQQQTQQTQQTQKPPPQQRSGEQQGGEDEPWTWDTRYPGLDSMGLPWREEHGWSMYGHHEPP
jgi:hypothetical protein